MATLRLVAQGTTELSRGLSNLVPASHSHRLPQLKNKSRLRPQSSRRQCRASAAETESGAPPTQGDAGAEVPEALTKEVAKVVKKTATTFAPRASTKTKNPAVPGSTLYTVFETQAYISMALGGLLSFNLIFPSDEPDLWRLMGMWSVWMFTIPSLRARDCSEKEKTALNYLFLVVPLINVILPIFWKSFAAVWSADVVAFFVFYAWKMDWLKQEGKASE